MNKQSPVKIIAVFVRKQKEQIANEVLNNMGASICLTIPARGIGHSELLSVMGLDLNESSVIVSAVKTEDAHKTLAKLCRTCELYKDDIGVAFSIPITAISRDTLNGLLEMAKQTFELNLEKSQPKVEEKQIKTEQKNEEDTTKKDLEEAK
ncbi:MAG: hypothetical protein IJ837_02635 [Clostridia bacterium]|nr:hypothetical protein [Clostridia bacterium]